MTDRRQDASAARVEAAEIARSRYHPEHKANGDEERYAGAKYFMSFTKGLSHNRDTGLLEDPQDFQALTYPNDPFILSVPTFDGKVRRV